MRKKATGGEVRMKIACSALLLAAWVIQPAQAGDSSQGAVGSLVGAGASSPSAAGPVGARMGATQIDGVFAGPNAPVIRLNGNATSSGSHSPYARWNQALSADLLNSDTVHARLKYFRDNSRNGSHQGVGIAFSLSN